MIQTITRVCNRSYQTQLELEGRTYRLWVVQRVSQPVDAPRLVVVSRIPNRTAQAILQVCIETIQRYTPEPHELWVVDNHSPWWYVLPLLRYPNINIAANRTEPLPVGDRGGLARLWHGRNQQARGSYANAIALEIALRLIHPESRYIMPLHMDIMPCRTDWLTYLHSQLKGKVAASGVRMDRERTPEGVLHVLGYIVDLELFRRYKLDFFPHLPQYDVGDRVTVELRAAGYEVFACPNTLRDPHLIETIPVSSPLRSLHVDRSFDDQGNVIFLHLGRGVRKATGEHTQGTTPEEWVRFAREYCLVDQKSSSRTLG